MANATPSRLGQANATGDELALFLKVFAGEILEAFDRESVARSRHQVRTIPYGKSAQFPVLGLAAASYHTPGAEITGQTIRHGERVINVEDLLIAPVFIANIDEAMNHYDVRAPYSNEIGQALARTYDKNVLRTMVRAARAAANLTGLSGGYTNNDADYATSGQDLWVGIFNAGVAMDEKDVPMSDRNAFLKPVSYALVVQSEKPIDRDLSPDNGSLAEGIVKRVNAIPLIKSNNLPTEDDRANTAIPALRRFDYSPTKVIIAHPSAAGTVQLQDVTTESEYDIRRQGTLMVGKYLVGHDYLRPESAAELRTADPAT